MDEATLQEIRFATDAIEGLSREIQSAFRNGQFDSKPRPEYEIVAGMASMMLAFFPIPERDRKEAIEYGYDWYWVKRARAILSEAKRQCAEDKVQLSGSYPLMKGAMRFDGSKESAEMIAAWIRLADDPEDDALFSWLTTDDTGEVPHDVQLATNDGHVEVEPGDWIIRLGHADYVCKKFA